MDCETVETNSALQEVLKWLAVALLCTAEWGLFYQSLFHS